MYSVHFSWNIVCVAMANILLVSGCVVGVANGSDKVDSRRIQEDWTDWRGPRRDGVSRETGLLLDWRERQPKILWNRPLGLGFSSFSVADSRLYTMASIEDVEYAICLHAHNGKTIWKTRSATTYRDTYGGDGPRSTPVVDDNRVYTLGAAGMLMSLDTLTGDVYWRRNVLDDFGAENTARGVSTSPLVDGDKLLVNVGAQGASVVALHKTTGRVIWKAFDDVPGYSSPIMIRVDGADGEDSEFIYFTGKALVGLSPADGAEHWRHQLTTAYSDNVATPIFDPSTRLLFVSSSGDTGGCAMYRITANANAIHSELVYNNKNMRNQCNSCVLVDGYIYGFDKAILKCLKFDTGEVMWEDRSVGKGSLLAAQGHLFVLGERGDLALVQATPDLYLEKGQCKALESTRAWTPAALANGRLYIRDVENAVCIDISNGYPSPKPDIEHRHGPR